MSEFKVGEEDKLNEPLSFSLLLSFELSPFLLPFIDRFDDTRTT